MFVRKDWDLHGFHKCHASMCSRILYRPLMWQGAQGGVFVLQFVSVGSWIAHR